MQELGRLSTERRHRDLTVSMPVNCTLWSAGHAPTAQVICAGRAAKVKLFYLTQSWVVSFMRIFVYLVRNNGHGLSRIHGTIPWASMP